MRAKTIQQLYLSAVIAFGVAVPSFAQDRTTNQAIDENLGDHTKYEAMLAQQLMMPMIASSTTRPLVC